jgi:hypothetical protein
MAPTSQLAVCSNKPIHQSTGFERVMLAPSSIPGKFRKLSVSGERTVTSVLEDGTILEQPADAHDGPFEAGEIVNGSRLVYNYDSMKCQPVVFDLMILATS